MQTDELIDRLALEAGPARGDGVPARLSVAAALGAAGALCLMLAWLHIRPDLTQALTTWNFWMKLAYGLVLAIAGFVAAERLARPAGSGRRGLALALAGLAVLAGLGAAQLMTAPADLRMGLWLGQSWRYCPFNILALSGPLMAAGLFMVRSLAPTRLVLAGAATGLLAGGVAMVVYGLHCPETEPAFVATWYSLGAGLTAAVGAILGPIALRWR